MVILGVICLIVLVVINIVVFYKVERLIKINKWWFPFFHLIISYLILWVATFLVSLFFNLTSVWSTNQWDSSIWIVAWGFSNQWHTSLWVVGWLNGTLHYSKNIFIQSSIFYVLSIIGMLMPLFYVTYLFTRLSWLRGYFSVLWIVPIVNFFYYPYLLLRISKKFKKWIGSTLLLLFFEPIYFPILILKNEKSYLWLDGNINTTKKEVWIVYWVYLSILAMLVIMSIIATKKLVSTQLIATKKLVSTQQKAMDIAREANLSSISTALTMYFNDQWEYPKKLENSLVPTYLMSLPIDPQTHKWYFYRSVYCKWAKNAWFVLAAKMSNPHDCNMNVYSAKKLWKLIDRLNKKGDTCTDIEKMIQTNSGNHNFKKGCYYIEQ